MSKTNKELYEDISKIFVEHGICSTDFAKLTELYRRTEMEGMVTEKRVIDEVINRFEKCRNMVDFNYALNEYIRDFGVSYE